jgi:general secretion pathway protein E
MPTSTDYSLDTLLRHLDQARSDETGFGARAVDLILDWGSRHGASDIHFQPTREGLEVKFRLDGFLHPGGCVPTSVAPTLIARLKVLAELLTYQTETPQEGRIRRDRSEEFPPGHNRKHSNGRPRRHVADACPAADVPSMSPMVRMRLSTFPTLYGERAVVRLFTVSGRLERLDELGFPEDVHGGLRRLLDETSGAIITTGPAGSGKTTTAYACLRELVARSGGGRSLVSLEDPIEMAVDGVAQSQIEEKFGFNLATGLRFLMRQDPEVILVGEIRDRATAEAAMEASLAGHLLLSTFHAGSAAEALGRLADMGIEPYVLRSGLLAITSQRLTRRLCRCATWSEAVEDRRGLPIERARVVAGCPECLGSGYRGRMPLVEMAAIRQTELGQAILRRADTEVLARAAAADGMTRLFDQAVAVVEQGHTSAAEVRRVLGLHGDCTDGKVSKASLFTPSEKSRQPDACPFSASDDNPS